MRKSAKMTWILVAINVVVWLAAGNDHPQVETWGLLPATFNAALAGDSSAAVTAAVTAVTQLFVHNDDVSHVGFNMLFLIVFGRAVEQYLGRRRFLATYFAAGLASAAAYVMLVPDGYHTYGASASVCGVAGAYLALVFVREFRSHGWTKLLRFTGAALSLALVLLNLNCLLDVANAKLYGFTPCSHLAGYFTGVVLAMALCPKARPAARRAATSDPGASSGRVVAAVR